MGYLRSSPSPAIEVSSPIHPIFEISYEFLLHLPSVNIDPKFLGLSSNLLKSLPFSYVNNLFLDYVNDNFPLFLLVYTDGSVSPLSTGYAFTIPDLHI